MRDSALPGNGLRLPGGACFADARERGALPRVGATAVAPALFPTQRAYLGCFPPSEWDPSGVGVGTGASSLSFFARMVAFNTVVGRERIGLHAFCDSFHLRGILDSSRRRLRAIHS